MKTQKREEKKDNIVLEELIIEENPTDIESLLEDAFLDFVEAVYVGMKERGLNKKKLSEILGKTRAHVTKILGGTSTNNLTLRTMVEALRAVGKKMVIQAKPLGIEEKPVVNREKETASHVTRTDIEPRYKISVKTYWSAFHKNMRPLSLDKHLHPWKIENLEFTATYNESNSSINECQVMH